MAGRTATELLGLFLRYGQTFLVYQAAFRSPKHPFPLEEPCLPYMTPLLRTRDGIDLTCYLFPQISEDRPPKTGQAELTKAAAEAWATVIVFHGIEGHNYHYFDLARYLYHLRCNVFLLSYRGFSYSGGNPTEAGLKIDTQTALDYILSKPHLARVPIIVCGHGTGGAIAIDLASRNPSHITGIIVSNTYTSIPELVRNIIGPISFLCTQKWSSIDKLHLIPTSTPILMISGREDEYLPAELMDRLWQAAQKRGIPEKNSLFHWLASWLARGDTEPPREVPPAHDKFVPVAGGTYNSTLYSARYLFAVKEFVNMIRAQTQDRPKLVQAATIKKVLDRRWCLVDEYHV